MRVPTNSSTDPSLAPLVERDLPSDPHQLFQRWFHEAQSSTQIRDPNAMCLSTIDPSGAPEGRMVLLREVDESGFTFYTNSNSAKGRALSRHPIAALTFYWEPLSRQVRITGPVSPLSAEHADKYFHSRPRASQLGAWASDQSATLQSREVLEQRFEELRARFEGQVVPRPLHWNGYQVRAERFEFWQERKDRLHDRFEYTRSSDQWEWRRLNP